MWRLLILFVLPFVQATWNVSGAHAEFPINTTSVVVQFTIDTSSFKAFGWSVEGGINVGSSVCGPILTSGLAGFFLNIRDLRLLKEKEVAWCGQIGSVQASSLFSERDLADFKLGVVITSTPSIETFFHISIPDAEWQKNYVFEVNDPVSGYQGDPFYAVVLKNKN
eukprot:TRINITY_DN854_c0_g1_i5.p1 TRINITY_DN854_c0_g1~~TRINITY_DN854_c0_g1_i5.p1  ORF type:complete len:166 (-),score=28.15 TRINITY_DN854_c0_g1_i5:37-534(-)